MLWSFLASDGTIATIRAVPGTVTGTDSPTLPLIQYTTGLYTSSTQHMLQHESCSTRREVPCSHPAVDKQDAEYQSKYSKRRRVIRWTPWSSLLLSVAATVLLVGGLKWSGLLWDGPGEDVDNSHADAVLIDDATTMIKTDFVNKRKIGRDSEAFRAARALRAQKKAAQAPGKGLLLQGIESAINSLVEARGHARKDELSATSFEESLSLLRHAADELSSTYKDKGNEDLERMYFLALWDEALLRLHGRDCEEMDRLLHAIEHAIDLDSNEKASVALLRGYCLESQSSSKAGLYFNLARELSPQCHETLLDTRYQPSSYGHADHMPRDVEAYFDTLLDLHVFRELYGQRAALLRAEGGDEEFAHLHAPSWTPEVAESGDPFGAKIGWGLNVAGLDRAHELVAQNEFVIMREFFHPFEVRVLERFYKDKAETTLQYDANLGRISSYNDRIGMYLNHRYTEAISHVMGQKVKHSYAFLCHYEARDDVRPRLLPHTDREDNEFTVSAQIYSDPDSPDAPLWPIFVHDRLTLPEHSSWRELPPRERVLQCDVRTGDALIFLGRRHIHYRETLPEPLRLVASLLLHFVHSEFDFFDYKLVRQARDPSI